MQHRPNTDVSGEPFSDAVIEAVWEKARAMGTSAILRVDAWGWTIVRQDYGNVRSRYGWEVDHLIPVSHGGTDDVSNLQPLQWENNRRKDELQGLNASPDPINTHPLKSSSAPSSPPGGQKKRPH